MEKRTFFYCLPHYNASIYNSKVIWGKLIFRTFLQYNFTGRYYNYYCIIKRFFFQKVSLLLYVLLFG